MLRCLLFAVDLPPSQLMKAKRGGVAPQHQINSVGVHCKALGTGPLCSGEPQAMVLH